MALDTHDVPLLLALLLSINILLNFDSLHIFIGCSPVILHSLFGKGGIDPVGSGLIPALLSALLRFATTVSVNSIWRFLQGLVGIVVFLFIIRIRCLVD